MFIYYGFAFIIGSLVVLSPILNGRNAARLGTIRASFYNYFFATFSAILLALLFTAQSGNLTVSDHYPSLFKIPPINFLGGLIGCLVILIMNYFTVRIKAFYIVILPFIGQLSMGLVIDQLSGKVFSMKQLAGLLLILLGLLLSASPQKNSPKLLDQVNDSSLN